MKTFNAIVKVVTALAAITGAVYILATYGDKIVAWAKNLLNTQVETPAPAVVEETPAEEAAEEVVAAEEAPAEVAEETAEPEAEAEEAPAEEAVSEEAAPVADDADFEG